MGAAPVRPSEIRMLRPTDRQRRVLAYVDDSIRTRGFAPTLREILREIGAKSTNAANDHLRALERKGLLERDPMKSRAMRLTLRGREELGAHVVPQRKPKDDPVTWAAVPVFTRITGPRAPDDPTLPAGQRSESFFFERRPMYVGPRDVVFALKMTGDALVEGGICAGDLVLCKRGGVPRRGGLVVALVGDEACVRCFFPDGAHVRLEGYGKTPTIYVRTQDVTEAFLVGIAVGVWRQVDRAADA